MLTQYKFDNKCTLEQAENVVVFHHPCNDGFASAFLTTFALDVEKTFYIPYNYKDPDPINHVSHVLGKNVFFVDCTLRPFSKFNDLAQYASKLVVVDHHKTFMDDLDLELKKTPDRPQIVNGKVYAKTEGGVFVVFDLSKSGAVLTLESLEKVFGGITDLRGFDLEELSRFASYIQDRDLWQWRLSKSREFSAGLDLYPKDFDSWKFAVFDSESGAIFRDGGLILKAQKNRVDQICANATVRNVAGHYVPIVNTETDVSEVGERLLELYPNAPFSVSFRVTNGGHATYSLRARVTDDISVREIAESYGGGGHTKAAGFTIEKGGGKGPRPGID